MYKRMGLVKTDILMKLVGEYYEDKDAEDAKPLLFDKLPSQRNVKRKGNNKKEMNLIDIVQALHFLPIEEQQSDHDSDCLIFATANCHFLFLEVKNIDAGTIVTDIVSLKQEVKELKEENYQSQKSEVESRTQGSRPRPRTQKKIRGQGQGQPFRGQTLSRPRTEMLEAKTKDQGHKRKCSPKKRSSQKFFRRSPQKNVFKKFFNRSTKF